MEPVREGELHPLENSSILQVIFKRLKLVDLKSCRLVCREWCQRSTEAMEKIASSISINIDDDVWNAGKRLYDFMKLVEVVEESGWGVVSVPPFMQNFDIVGAHAESPLEIFLDDCGSSMKSLCLNVASLETGYHIREGIFQSCSNLEALTLIDSKNRYQDEEGFKEPKEVGRPLFPPNRNLRSLSLGTQLRGVTWMEFFCQFPALEKLEVLCDFGTVAELFRSLAIARKHDDQRWKIKDLKFPLELDSDSLEIRPSLENLRLPLEKLHVFDVRGSEDVAALRRFLAAHAPALTDLSLGGGGLVKVFPLPNNAVFEQVENLKLEDARLRSVSVLQSFPNLKKLILSSIRAQPAFSQERMGNWILDGCTELEITMDGLKTKDLRLLISKLPNLETLKISSGSNNRKFQVICELLPKLVQLELLETKVDDTGISGLDEEDVAEINEGGQDGNWWPITAARPNLTSLMNLERFTMTCRRDLNAGYTTAVCVQKLPLLQQFRIGGLEHLHPFWTTFRSNSRGGLSNKHLSVGNGVHACSENITINYM